MHDNCLFTKGTTHDFLALLVYIDDVLITSVDESCIIVVREFLHSSFTIKDPGYAKYFLGVEIARSASGLFLSQCKYILDILHDVGFLEAKPKVYPMSKNLKLDDSSSPLFAKHERYRRIVGKLLYFNLTRLDLSYAV